METNCGDISGQERSNSIREIHSEAWLRKGTIFKFLVDENPDNSLDSRDWVVCIFLYGDKIYALS